MRAKFLRKRYMAAALTVAASIAVTPASIEAAYTMRGYEAVGGEYFVIPLGLIAAFIVLEIAKVWDCFRVKPEQDDEQTSGQPYECEETALEED